MKKAFVFTLGLLVVASCDRGYKACVAGFGQCQEMWDQAQAKPGIGTQSGGSSRGDLIVNIDDPSIARNGTTNIEISGGTQPYTVTMEDDDQNTCEGGTSTGKCELTKSNEGLWAFKARDEKGGVDIVVKDANGTIKRMAIYVN